MRRTLLLLLSFLTCVAWGQSYRYRYWIDNNVGSAVSGSATGEKELTISLSSVGYGLHALHVQGRNAAGVWSSVRTRYFLKEKQDQACTSARYWIDNDMTTLHDGVATSGVIELDIAGLKNGLHAVHYQKMGADGTPSAVRTRYFLKEEENQAYTSARYWIDNDMTTVHDGVATSGIIDIDITKLGVGLHAVHYQKTGADGTPSAVRTRYFLVDRVQIGSLSANISIDDGEATSYALSDEYIVIDISDLEEGTHDLTVTLKDAQGNAAGQQVQQFTYERDHSNDPIAFVDDAFKALSLAHFDSDGNGELSYAEAAAVTSLENVFNDDNAYGITSLDDLQYFTGLTSLGYELRWLYALESIIIPKNVTSISVSVFEYWENLTSLKVDEENTVYDSRNDCNALIETATNKLLMGTSDTEIPSTVEIIGEGAFAYIDWNGTIPEGVREIEGEAFYSSDITSLTIPASVVKIGDDAFIRCFSLNAISVNSSNTVFDSRNDCNALIETATNTLLLGCGNTTIPASVTAIGPSAFEGCSAVKAIVVPDNVTSIGKRAFNGSDFTSITLPEGLSAIEEHALSQCYNLTSVTIPAQVKSIGYYAFYADKELEEIVLPEGVDSIAEGAFCYCDKLARVVIPSTVKTIGKNTFMQSMALTDVQVGMTTPIAIDATVFPNRANATLTVPFGTKTAYEAANYWKEFKEIVEMEGASESNRLYANDIDLNLSSPTQTIALQLDNEKTLIACEFNLLLPEGLSIEEDEDGYLVADIVGTRSDRHTFEARNDGGGKYHFLCYSNSNKAFKGNAGDFITLSIVADESLAEGDYTVQLQDIIFSDENKQQMNFANSSFTIHVVSYTPGDVNGDDKLNVMDIVEMVGHIMGETSDMFVFGAADIDGNGTVNVMDLVNLVEMIMNTANLAPAMTAFSQEQMMKAFSRMQLAKAEQNTITLGLPNADNCIAGQFVVTLTGGTTLQNVGSDRMHRTQFTHLGDGRYLVMVYSSSNAAFQAETPITLTMSGNCNATIDDVVFVNADKEAVAYEPAMLSTTGIMTVGTSFVQPADIYTVDGTLVKRDATSMLGIAKGVYIVNNKKMIVK